MRGGIYLKKFGTITMIFVLVFLSIFMFLTLSVLSLPVRPDIKITDKGLFDVKNFNFIDVCE